MDALMPWRSRILRYGPQAYWADSSGRRNTRCLLPCMDGSEEFVQSLGGRFPAKGLSGSRIEGERDGRKDIGIMHAEVGALGKVLAQQPVGVLVCSTLPGAVRVTEVDLDPGGDPQMGVLCHLRALVSDCRRGSGKVVIVRVMASRTASAPASAGPFLTRGPRACPGIGGRWRS